MRKYWRSTAAVWMLTGVILLPAVASGTPEPNVEICHFNADNDPNAPEWELLVVNNNSVAEKHVAHGDGFPGGEVPGTDGEFVFGEDCVPNAAATIFAVAYTDVVDDGEPYDIMTDVLVAKFVDGPAPANDGVPGPGDVIVTHRYPMDENASGFGVFSNTEHVLTDNDGVNVSLSSSIRCRVEFRDGAGVLIATFDWEDGVLVNGEFTEAQAFTEISAPFGFFDRTSFRDQITGDFVDRLLVRTASPSQPTDNDIFIALFRSGDDPYIDVDAPNCVG